MQVIYVEKDLLDHPRAKRILNRFTHKQVITCDHYGEILNRKAQNFRLQKQAPALILAKKKGARALPSPDGFGIGGNANYYFSHMLNCPYDCRYCFLQGMYRSAHYVVFINYEDFMTDISAIISDAQQTCYFFSGYDADSLAYEPITHFVADFMPFFASQSKAYFEFRTKSVNVRSLLKQKPIDNCIIAFSLTPQQVSSQVENKVPAVRKRIEAMCQLALQGWRIGLRFDPLIYTDDFKVNYSQLIADIFAKLPVEAIHSVSLGPLRFPAKMYQKITKLYPQEKFLVEGMVKRCQMYSYEQGIEAAMDQFVRGCVLNYIDSARLFSCVATESDIV